MDEKGEAQTAFPLRHPLYYLKGGTYIHTPMGYTQTALNFPLNIALVHSMQFLWSKGQSSWCLRASRLPVSNLNHLLPFLQEVPEGVTLLALLGHLKRKKKKGYFFTAIK